MAAGHQKFGKDNIGALVTSSASVIQLAPSSITVGGLQYDTSTLQASTSISGVGGIDDGTVDSFKTYNVFTILSAGNPALILSLNPIPAGFTTYTSVGKFTTKASGDINGTSDNNVGAVGDTKHSMLSESAFIIQNGGGWILMDGRDVAGSTFHSLTGNTAIPDARGLHLRGKNNTRSDGNENPDGDLDVGVYSGSKTAKPTTPLTGTSNTAGGNKTSTSGGVSVNHTHNGNTGTESADHGHSGSTGIESALHNHGGVNNYNMADGGGGNGPRAGTQLADESTGTQSANHTHAFSTGGRSAVHTHAFTTSGFSSNHTHNTTTNTDHAHTTSINAGGDNETSVKNISVNIFIKIN